MSAMVGLHQCWGKIPNVSPCFVFSKLPPSQPPSTLIGRPLHKEDTLWRAEHPSARKVNRCVTLNSAYGNLDESQTEFHLTDERRRSWKNTDGSDELSQWLLMF